MIVASAARRNPLIHNNCWARAIDVQRLVTVSQDGLRGDASNARSLVNASLRQLPGHQGFLFAPRVRDRRPRRGR
jgi:hypothetical protein